MSCDDALGDLDCADVLIEGTKVREVGEGLEAAGGDVDAEGMLFIPGMVDTHTQLWETLARTYAGAVELLAAASPRSRRATEC